MSAPSTPRKPRTAAHQQAAASPARPSTPSSRVPKSTAAATASPQSAYQSPHTASPVPVADGTRPPAVRAALAALRQKRQPSSDSVASPTLAPAPDQFSTPARASTSTQPAPAAREPAPPQEALVGDGDEHDDVVLEWNVKGEDKLVEAARKTGASYPRSPLGARPAADSPSPAQVASTSPLAASRPSRRASTRPSSPAHPCTTPQTAIRRTTGAARSPT